MLDTPTRKRIDDCRDILVGKLPDPKAQIEQITIGLIYKFMDDMDEEAIELGGQARFFADYKIADPEFPDDRSKDKFIEFSKYAWNNLLNPKVTASEMLKLYSEAIEGMEKNPNIPQLFRDIFNNAYLPYRDPETLKLFLKTIGEFEYTHSEKLGDAFEYLLSVMGSQGDAGQFRTPRHIIDFLVAIINPDKTDRILDPACGTAGFLISAYKHILLRYTRDNRQGLNIYQYNKLISLSGSQAEKPFNNLGDKLNPDEQRKLIQNFTGYDISPDMVRLSLVNLYLHGFNTPNIHEYDTLSSEERWKETSDVILANPPFMSPKGGIRPHKKFTISSNRSEVLFVDYIAEHLNPNGKAGIIVPEGIIFQSGTAYKALRKMLVENYLYAVVSLPAGVFNPYSGVKTSILLLDKEVSKKRTEILFVKIDNDGYNLGAQRSAVKGSQLEEAIELAHEFVASGKTQETALAHLVSKAVIAGNGDYNLSGERYKTNMIADSKFEMVELSNEEIFRVVSGGTPSSDVEKYWNGDINWATLIDLPQSDFISTIETTSRKITEEGLKNSSAKVLPVNSIIVSTRATIGRIAINKAECSTNQGFKNIIICDFNKANSVFVALMMTRLVDKMNSMATGGTFKELSTSNFKTLQIPLPPLSIQQEIVAEIESYQKIIDGAKAVVANYKPNIDIDPEWEMVELGEVCENFQYGSSKKSKSTGDVICLRMGNIQSGEIDWSDIKYATNDEEIGKYLLEPGDVLFNRTNSPVHVGKTGVYRGGRIAVFAGYLIRLNYRKNKILGEFLNYCLNTKEAKDFCQKVKTDGINQSNINAKTLATFRIPLPSLQTQRQIVAQIEKEQELVNANKQLIEIFEQKIKDRIARVWGEERKQDEPLLLAAEPQVEYLKS